ncbi:helix-turn-helix transcriptional regulator [uncultured Tissierella sp.]|uniref:helix-turn-helix domain-containing protein n=1 Tax=uncultured Tissierella sp. TaxID=448160 RepID=UPI00280633F2|nr:helix-turn-helix transcriptional regulator [uncultured Tissierella sp.]MDU5082737.1 helix-turn-helix transcriptional regulator [Bacillota bacterium]
MDTIGKRIRYARKTKKLSLSDVKEKTGISTGNLSELENDKFAPSASSLIAFKQLFNVSIDWLLTGESPMAPNSNEVIKESQKPLELSDEEKNLITAYRTLDKEAKRNIQGYINVVLNQNLNI